MSVYYDAHISGQFHPSSRAPPCTSSPRRASQAALFETPSQTYFQFFICVFFTKASLCCLNQKRKREAGCSLDIKKTLPTLAFFLLNFIKKK